MTRKWKFRPYTREGFGILNPYGDVWTDLVFETEQEAKNYVAKFWGASKSVDHSEFKIITVTSKVSITPSGRAALSQEPTS